MTTHAAGIFLAIVLVWNTLSRRKPRRGYTTNVLDTFATLVDKTATRWYVSWLARFKRKR